MRNTLDFRLAINVGVVAFALAVLQRTDTTRLTEVNTTGQFTHNQDIQTRNYFWFKRRCIRKLRVQNGWTQVTEQLQTRTQTEQAFFRTQLAVFEVIPLRTTYRTQQNCVCRAGFVHGLVWQWRAMYVVGRTTDQTVHQLQAEIEFFVRYVQNLNGFCNDFRANTIARQDQYVFAHF